MLKYRVTHVHNDTNNSIHNSTLPKLQSLKDATNNPTNPTTESPNPGHPQPPTASNTTLAAMLLQWLPQDVAKAVPPAGRMDHVQGAGPRKLT